MRLTFGTGGVDFQSRVDYGKLRSERLARIQALLRAEGIASMLLARPNNIRYATGLRGPVFASQLRYALIFADHAPVMFELGDMLETQRSHADWIPEDNWRFSYCSLDGIGGPAATEIEAGRFAGAIVDELRSRGVADDGLAVDAIDEPSRAALVSCGVKLTGAGPIMQRVRVVKTAEEIQCIQLAIDIGNVGFAAVLEHLKPGVREADIGAEVHAAMIRAGAENTGGRVRSGLHTFPLYHIGNTDRRVEPGDLVQLNTCSTSFNGYMNCIYRNFVCGRAPTTQEQDWASSTNDRIQSVISEIRPGATTADAAKHFLPASTWGYEAEQPLLVAELGHGFGMGYEPPVISRVFSFDNPQVFEPGMVIAVECRDGDPAIGGVRVEEMVVVTEDGCDQLTRWPADVAPVATVWG